ncbi:zinc ribbon domain-containing protein [Leptolyngbya iicbica]|uniref:Zinc ribbon domain-containing protein n=2 Tax=Cyanophyceae TaxID=3028117 RepID=A0A4Q7EHK6_9CYAN|nr:zinc ribbon domain-containing protein [Leptolyngbya sp. LK]RZM82823.1 zinc ribbon domain-containing protein [Leptolyngbya sp. LK]
MGKVYEMLWDCKFCGQKKLFAKTDRTCPQCGASQDPSWRYFPSDADKVEVKNYTFAGKDRICSACDSINAADQKFCIRCGAPMKGAEEASTVPSRSKRHEERFATQNLDLLQEAQREQAIAQEMAKRQAMRHPRRARQRTQPAKPARRSLGDRWMANKPVIIGGSIASVTGLGGLVGVVMYSMTIPATVAVTGHDWQRRIAIEVYETRSDSDWQGSVPSGAYDVSCSTQQSGTRRIADGETCSTQQVDQGDGTFREESFCTTTYREEPVYDEHCTYKVDEWNVDEWVIAVGAGLSDEPMWPTVNIQPCSSTSLGCKRQGRSIETYTLQLVDVETNKSYRCDRPQSEWRTTPVGTQFEIEIGRFYDDARCHSLVRQ